MRRQRFTCMVLVVLKNVAEEAQRILLTMHHSIIVLHDVHELKMVLNRSEDNDLFFIISLSGETTQLPEITNLLQLRQKYFISVTTLKDNTLAQKANYNVYVSSNTFYLYDGTDYSSFISYHIFLKHYYVNTTSVKKHMN